MRNPDRQTIFQFKQFAVANRLSAMKVGTDSVLLGAWAFTDFETACREGKSDKRTLATRILDIGCGTGLLALMMAQRFTDAKITAIDIDSDASIEASDNFRNSPWGERCEAVQGDLLQWAEHQKAAYYDLIISNPPYFVDGPTAPEQSRCTARHQNNLPIRKLLENATRLLAPSGKIALVIPYEQTSQTIFEAQIVHLYLTRSCTVTTRNSKPPRRSLLEFSNDNESITQPSNQTLIIHNHLGEYTQPYIQLVSPFYMNL